MAHFNLFLFTLLAVCSLLPSGLALPQYMWNGNGTGPSSYPGGDCPLDSSSVAIPPATTTTSHFLGPGPVKHTSTSTPEPKSTPPATPSGSGSTSSSDIQTFLDSHNVVREAHGADNLTWSNSLAVLALSWTKRCQFVHSDGALGQYGENLAAGYDIAGAVQAWAAEASSYDPNNPVASHFTQVVWKGSTELGCSIYSCPANTVLQEGDGPANFIACEYSPPGNVEGEFSENVQV